MAKRDTLNEKVVIYNLKWPPNTPPIAIEMFMVKKGGQWKKTDGTIAGNGLYFHFRRLQELLWPKMKWHRWRELQTEMYLKHRIIGEMGPASSGKSATAACNVLADYYCFPDTTTVLVSSTTKESLENRIWGEIKRLHRAAKEIYPHLAGHLSEGRQRIITDARGEFVDGRDFRNGMMGIPAKKGSNFQGIGEAVGIKNKRVRLIGDELHLMPRSYIDAIANLNKNPDFKFIGLGNPKETTDALGMLCEPAAHLGGWDGGLDQAPKTKTWETRYPNGVCIQLCGSDSPNLDGSLGIDIITQANIDADVAVYGKDSLNYTMMNEGRMPRGEGSRRVITRQMCLKHHAFEQPVWRDERHTKIAFLDASLGGVGGDRSVFGELDFGFDVNGNMLMLLKETLLVQASVSDPNPADDQIAQNCADQCIARGIPPTNFFFDCTGRGALMNAFGRLWSPHVQGIEFGGPPSDHRVAENIALTCREYYSKKVSELWFAVRMVILGDQFRGMTEEVMQEFGLREWTIVAGNKTEVEPKWKTKVKNGRSPDLADAVAAGVWGAIERGFIIAKLAGTRSAAADHRWKTDLKKRVRESRQRYQLDYRA